MFEDGELVDELEIVVFSIRIKFIIFYAMTSKTFYLIAKNDTFSNLIYLYLLLTNNNYFDLLLIRIDLKKIDIIKFNKKDY